MKKTTSFWLLVAMLLMSAMFFASPKQAKAQADLSLTQTPLTTPLCANTATPIMVNIANLGPAVSTNITVTCSVDGVPVPGSPFGIPMINPGAMAPALFTYNFPNPGKHVITTTVSSPVSDPNPANDNGSQVVTVMFNGTFTIGTLGIRNFTTVKQAVDTVNLYGLCGPTIFKMDNDIETSANILLTTNTTSATNTLTFEPATAGTYHTIMAAPGVGAMDGIFIISGTDYVTLDGLALSENPANVTIATQMEYGFALLKPDNTNGCQYNVIRNCGIQLNKLNTNVSYGIYVANHTPASVTALTALTGPAATNSFNKFYSNGITNVYRGISLNGFADVTPFALYDQNNEIGKDGRNIITNFGGGSMTSTPVHGIFGIYQNNIIVSNDSINGGAGTSASTIHGIHISTASNANVTITNNRITLQASTLTNQVYGIRNEAGSGTGTKVIINNNKVFGIAYSTATTGALYGIHNVGASDSVIVKNNQVYNLSSTGTGVLYGIYSNGACNNLLIANDSISGLSKTGAGNIAGVYQYLTAVGGTETIINNTISNLSNTVAATIYGINTWPDATTNKVISRNRIFGLSGLGTIYGIANSAGNDIRIFKNQIFNFSSTAAASLVDGIYISSGTTVNIYNNFISDLKTPAATGANAIVGVYVAAGATASNINYNTIYINATSSSTTTFGTAGIYASVTPTVTLRNNIVVNLSTPVGTSFSAVYKRSGATLTSYANASNNNNFYCGTPSATKVIYYDGTNSDLTLAAYKTRVAPRDANSVNENSPFINVATTPYDLHISTTIPTQCESGGAPVSTPVAITDDIDGNSRNASVPDIGADEFAGIMLDLVAPSITYTPLPNTTNTVSYALSNVVVTDASGVDTAMGTRPRIYFKKLGHANTFADNTSATDGWKYAEANGNTSPFDFTIDYTKLFGGTVSVFDTIVYFVVAQDKATTPNVGINLGTFTTTPSSVNLTAAAFPVTGVRFYKILGTICGNKTIGVGGDYTTLTAAVTNLNNCQITCPVVFEFIDNTYPSETFPIIVYPNVGSSAVNTVTFRPAATKTPVIAGKSNTGIFLLYGVDYVTLDGSNSGGTDRSLTFRNDTTIASTYTIGFFNSGGTNGAQNNTIKNCVIKAGYSVANSTYAVILNASGGDFDNTVITNNQICRARYGLQFAGVAAGITNRGIITNNIFGSSLANEGITYRGIITSYCDSTIISGNEIMGVAAGTANFYQNGIYVGTGSTNTKIRRNSIHDFYYNGTAGYGCFGITYASDASSVTEISNNFIYKIKADGDAASATFAWKPYGIAVSSGGNCQIYYNTVYMSDSTLSSAFPGSSACLGINTGVTLLDVRNNLFKNSMQPLLGSTMLNKTYAVISLGTGTEFSTLDYNDLYVDGKNPNIGYISTADQATLAAWKTATGKEVNSLNLNPTFISSIVPMNLHLATTGNCGLDGKAIPIPSVTVDIDNTTRNTVKPDIGADEFNPDLPVSPVASSQSNCFGDATPDLSATGTTGTLNWYSDSLMTTLVFTGSPFATGNTAAGIYTYWVAETIGLCQSLGTKVTLSIIPIPARPVTADLNGCTGATIPDLTAGGTGTMNWYNDGALTSLVHTGSSYSTGNTAAGTYTYYVTQTISGCVSKSDTVTLTINTTPTASIISSMNPSACGLSDGNATASGGTSYVWSDGQILAAATGFPAGTHYVTVTTNGCSDITSVTLTDPGAPTVTLVSNDTSVCAGTSVTFTAGGATTYEFFINGTSVGAASTVNTYSSSTLGNGSVITVNGITAGCTGTSTNITMQVDAAPVAGTANINDPAVCEGLTTSLTLTGYTGNIQWQESPNGITFSNIIGATSDIYTTVPLTATTYYQAVVSNGVCSPVTSAIVNVVVSPYPIVDLGNDTVICVYDNVVLDAGAGATTYVWSTGDNTSSIVADTTGLGAGTFTYIVTVTTNGCSTVDSVHVTFDPCTGINENNFAFNCYPNPTQGLLTIEMNRTDNNTELSVVNSNGQLMLRRKISSTKEIIDMSMWTSGIYNVILSDGKYLKTARIIVQR